jgi:hypothetical protein
MATKKTNLPIADPAELANRKILKARQERIIAKEVEESIDLGLNLKEPEPESAAEMLHEEWDKKAFGSEVKTTTRVIYGPDPVVSNCPEFHDRLEKYGLEACAEAFFDLIMQRGELAAPDPIMRKGLRGAIAKFGKEATAKAFRDRILQIPSRTVEVELDGALDPLLSNPMRDAVQHYGHPGMAVKFLSERCMDVLGMRGYVIVKKDNGDPVKVGTLFMGEIPEDWAERRRQHWADESTSQLQEQEEKYYENAKRDIASEGGRAAGASLLRPGDTVKADPALNDLYTGDARETGIRIGK